MDDPIALEPIALAPGEGELVGTSGRFAKRITRLS